MIVTGALAWWDEPPEDLAACVASMANLCDRVVAVDGAYVMTPGGKAVSPQEQVRAIEEAALAADIDCVVWAPKRLWPGQVAKRCYMLRVAASGSDWVMNLDADHRIVCDREAVRGVLEESESDWIQHWLRTPVPPGTNVQEVAPHAWHANAAGSTVKHSFLKRALTRLRVMDHHWWYMGEKDGMLVRLGMGAPLPTAPHEFLDGLRVDHLCFSRDRERLERNRLYIAARDAYEAEHGFEP